MESYDVNNLLSSFYSKCNKLVDKHAPIKTISNRKTKPRQGHPTRKK